MRAERKAQGLQAETDAEDGEEVGVGEVPEVVHDADVVGVGGGAGAWADDDGVEGGEEGEEGGEGREGVDVDCVDCGGGGEGEEGGEVGGEGIVGVD